MSVTGITNEIVFRFSSETADEVRSFIKEHSGKIDEEQEERLQRLQRDIELIMMLAFPLRCVDEMINGRQNENKIA